MPAGSVHVRIRLHGELTSEYYGFLFTGRYNGKLPERALWYDTTEQPTGINLMPSVREIMEYLMNGEIATREYEIDVL